MKKRFRPVRKSIGKKIGSHFYIHKSAIECLPKDLQYLIDQAICYLPTNSPFEVIKICAKDGSVSFIQSPDWNISPEPIVGDSIKICSNGDVKLTKGREQNPQIYHHKWLFVSEDYTGFDVEESKRRSELWENAGLDIDKKKIGNLNYWQESVLTKLGEVNDIRVDLTCLKQVPALFKDDKLPIGPINLDIGGGKFELGTQYLATRGVTNYIYDTYSRDYNHNASVISDLVQVDTVSVTNVLNVVKCERERAGIIAQAAAFVKEDGLAYFQIYEGNRSGVPSLTSRKTWQENRKCLAYVEEIEPFFRIVTRKGATLICSSPIKDIADSLLELQGRQWVIDTRTGNFILNGQHKLVPPNKSGQEIMTPCIFSF